MRRYKKCRNEHNIAMARLFNLALVVLGAAITLIVNTAVNTAVASTPAATYGYTSPPPGRRTTTHRQQTTRNTLAEVARASPSASSPPRKQQQQRPVFFLVASPESNGNRYMVKLMTTAGCYGVSGHHQPLDTRQRPPVRSKNGAPATPEWPNHIRSPDVWPAAAKRAPCLAMHRSIPHNHVWVNITQLVAEITAAGYEPRLVVMLRREDIAADSQVHAKHVRTEPEAAMNILHAQRALVNAIAAMPRLWFRLVLYHQLGDESYVRWLFSRDQLGVTLPPAYPRFEDRDSKHIEHVVIPEGL